MNAQHKKILFLNANLQPGGAERQMVTVARLLKQRGHDVSFYCYGDGNFYEHLLVEDGIPVTWDYTFTNIFKRISHTRRFIRKGKYDAVISFLQPVNFLNVLSGLGCKKWKVITGLRYCPAVRVKLSKEKFYLWFQSFSDAVVSNSELARIRCIDNVGSNRNKIYVIYNHVKINDIKTVYTPKFDGRLHIVVAASYQYLKNPLGLVEALKLMTEEERQKIVIDWYGSNTKSTAYTETASAVADMGIQSEFVLHDAIKNIHDVMNQSDVVMLLSKEEGLPNAICEGMSLGKPIIMSRVSDFNVLVDETNGVLCDWDNPISIKEAIVNLTNKTNNQLIEMGEHSRTKARMLFSGDSILEAWEKLLI